MINAHQPDISAKKPHARHDLPGTEFCQDQERAPAFVPRVFNSYSNTVMDDGIVARVPVRCERKRRV